MTEKLNSSNLRQNPRNVNELVNELTLFDDDLMSRVFDKNIKATELLLRIILGKKVKVISVTGQNEMKNHQVGGRNITLDVDAMDENGEEIDIEVQGNSEGAHVRRARYHSSMVDSRMLKEGQAFRELKDSYVIFIYKHDKFRKGLPLYHVDRYVGETNEQFRDGSHIIYVNGNYKGNDEIGQLSKGINDFMGQLQSVICKISKQSEMMQKTLGLMNTEVNSSNDNVNYIASMMEQITASMEEITASVEGLSSNTQDVLASLTGIPQTRLIHILIKTAVECL